MLYQRIIDFLIPFLFVFCLLSLSLDSMGVQLPGTWQSVPPQPQLTSAAAAAAPQITQSVGGALPQAAGVVAYPMQQFQVSPQVSYLAVDSAYA